MTINTLFITYATLLTAFAIAACYPDDISSTDELDTRPRGGTRSGSHGLSNDALSSDLEEASKKFDDGVEKMFENCPTIG